MVCHREIVNKNSPTNEKWRETNLIIIIPILINYDYFPSFSVVRRHDDHAQFIFAIEF